MKNSPMKNAIILAAGILAAGATSSTQAQDTTMVELCQAAHAQAAAYDMLIEPVIDSCIAGTSRGPCPPETHSVDKDKMMKDVISCIKKGYFPPNLKDVLARNERMREKLTLIISIYE